jgi:branched-chain amino acid transport system ATP-binding protein
VSRLELQDVDAHYGKSHVLYDVSMTLEAGSLVTLVGRNGAGKTTCLKSIMGLLTPTDGRVTFDGEDVTELSPDETARRGIALIPEERRIVPELTVRENVRLGYIAHDVDEPFDAAFQRVGADFPILTERGSQRAGTLSGGEQQMLAIARALVSKPDLLLIDEPTEGLMPSLVEKVRDRLVKIHDDGITVLLVEQNVNLALDVSDYGYVIDEGVIQEEGPTEQLRENEEIQRRYLTL